MSDRRGYPTAYRRSALPQHVRQRGFQPLPMLPVAPRTPLRVGKYAKWAGRLARLHPALRAASLALDVVDLLPGLPIPGGEVLFEAPGYQRTFDCGCSPNHLSTRSFLYACNQVYESDDHVGSGSVTGRPRRVRGRLKGAPAHNQPGYSQYRRCIEWERPATDPYPDGGDIEIKIRPPSFVPGRIGLPDSPSYRPPQWQPEAWPIGVPAPAPVPVPFPSIPGRVPNPTRSPTEQSEWGNEVPPVVPSPEVPTPGVIVLPTPGNPTPEPGPEPQPETPFPSPPATTRTRERKVILAVAGVPARIVSALTETNDVINAFWAAMPEKFQRAHKFRYGRLTRPHEKALLIWENLDQLDIGAAITNLAWEQLEDMAYGRLGKLQARAARKRRAMHGFTLGPAL